MFCGGVCGCIITETNAGGGEGTFDAGGAAEVPYGGALSEIGESVGERMGVAAGAREEGGEEVVVGRGA